MASLEATLAQFRPRLRQLMQENPGPGLSFAVSRGDDVFTAAAGIANLNTGLPVTADTKFLIGSNTKALTITLMCRAMDDGLVDLNERVVTYLPDFRTADDVTTETVTVRDLLLHTNGIGGDFAGGRFFPYRDFGSGDDAIANLVAAMPENSIVHPVGLTWAYSNAAYVVAGRILEVIHGKPYAALLRERLLDPLGMVETCLSAEESILGPTAVGHGATKSGTGLGVVDHYALPRALAPAGAIINSTARDLLRFGRLLLDKGKAVTGEQILAEATVEEMLKPAVRIPQPMTDVHMCLSMLFEPRPDHRRYRSSGMISGQASVLHLLPDHDLVLVGLGNGPGSIPAATAMVDEVVKALTGLDPMPAPVVPDQPTGIDLSPYVGTYESPGVTTEVDVHDGQLQFSYRLDSAGPDAPAQVVLMTPIGNHQFVGPDRTPGSGCTFLEVVDGRARYLWMARVSRRVA